MTFITTAFAVLIGSVTGSFSSYFIQRYFFKKVMDNALDKFEDKLVQRFRRKTE